MDPGGGSFEGLTDSVFTTQNLSIFDYLSISKFNKKFKNNFTLMSQNVRSLARNGSKLEDLVKQTLPSVVALQEIWRGDIKIDGYSGTFLERDGRGGGVGFLFSEELTPSIHASHIDFNIEYLIIKIEKCFYASIYIPNRSNVEAALVTLKKEIRKINQNEIFLLGDFNTDLLREDHLANKFHAFMQELNTYPTISKPTRKKSYTLIDNILTNTSADISSGIIPTSISDHMTPFLAISKRNPIKPKKIKKRIFSPSLSVPSGENLICSLLALFFSLFLL